MANLLWRMESKSSIEMVVSKSITFDAAHYLPGYEGKCKNMHGHRWKVEIGVQGPIDLKSGMVVDFTILKAFLESIKEEFDHQLVNEKVENPTAENICLFIESRWKEDDQVIDQARLIYIKVWETETSCCTLDC